MEWKPFQIESFKGIAASTVNPDKSHAQISVNLDTREKSGELCLRSGYGLKYDAPTHPRLTNVENLSFENFSVPILEVSQEVTVLIQKAVLNSELGSGAGTKNVLAFWIRPFYGIINNGNVTSATTSQVTTNITSTENQYVGCSLVYHKSPPNNIYFRKILSHTTGANTVFTTEVFPVVPSGICEIYGWTDACQWLNEMVLTEISTIDGTYKNELVLNYTTAPTDNYLMKWNIENITKNDDSVILSSIARLGNLQIANPNNTWAVSDVVLLSKNYFPYLEEMSSISDISFYKVLNDLRITFGGYKNRITLAIGYRQKSLQINQWGGGIDTLFPTFPLLSQFNTINEIILNPYNSISKTGTISVTPSTIGASGVYPVGTFYYYISIVLDGFNEFLIAKGSQNTSLNDALKLTIKFLSTFNKRITGVRIYLSESSLGAAQTNPYFLAADYQLTQDTYDTSSPWIFDTHGFAVLVAEPAYVDFLTDDNAVELEANIGYPITMDYASSFDMAIMTHQGKVLALNTYIDSRLIDLVLFSPISGSGAYQYDVLQAGSYWNLSNFDGNDLVGIEILPNYDIATFRQNSTQRTDSQQGVSQDIAVDKGCKSRQSIKLTGNGIAWAGEADIYTTDGRSYNALTEGTIREEYRALADKSLIIATREEKDSAYRFFSGDTVNKSEFLLANSGWLKQVRNDYPQKYTLAKDGTVWFMNNGKIFYDNGSALDNETGISFQRKSIPFDAFLIADMKEDIYFYLRSLWIEYDSNVAFTVNLYLDKSPTVYDSFVIDTFKNTTSKRLKLFNTTLKRGLLCKFFEIEIVGVTSSANNTVKIQSMGGLMKPKSVGIYA